MPTMRELRDRARREGPEVIATAICRLFPDLQHAPGVDPWIPGELDTWAISDMRPSGTRANVRFILSIWSGADADVWKVGAFKLSDVALMDRHGLRALQEWTADPFWL